MTKVLRERSRRTVRIEISRLRQSKGANVKKQDTEDSDATYKTSVTLRSIVSALIMDDGERHAETPSARILADLNNPPSDVVVGAGCVRIPRAFTQ